MTNVSQKPVAIITGASAGIGDAITRRFAREGWNLLVVARRKERLENLANDLNGIAEVIIVAGDVSNPAIPKQVVTKAKEAFGRLDCLVNNAGSGKWAPVHETDDAIMDEVIELSLKAPLRFCREAIPEMTTGSIINMGSVFGTLGGLDGGIYCAVKSALVGLTQTMAAQYGAQGIRTNLVAPGVIRTDMTDAAWDIPGFQRINQEMTPINRDGTTEDIANAVYFLASDQGSYINGQTLALDGGWSTTKYLSLEALTAERVKR
ncbi:MAG: SDR family oxidoreductase [Spongiibacteraceae bacterium]|nr:SDR family oxidoreductase [Spongiibacteraceae bacterium]